MTHLQCTKLQHGFLKDFMPFQIPGCHYIAKLMQYYVRSKIVNRRDSFEKGRVMSLDVIENMRRKERFYKSVEINSLVLIINQDYQQIVQLVELFLFLSLHAVGYHKQLAFAPILVSVLVSCQYQHILMVSESVKYVIQVQY